MCMGEFDIRRFSHHQGSSTSSSRLRNHIIPYHIISYPTILYHTIPYYTVAYSNHTILFHVISYQIIAHHTIPYHIIPHHTIPIATPLHHTISYYTILYHVILWSTTTHQATSYCIPPSGYATKLPIAQPLHFLLPHFFIQSFLFHSFSPDDTWVTWLLILSGCPIMVYKKPISCYTHYFSISVVSKLFLN